MIFEQDCQRARFVTRSFVGDPTKCAGLQFADYWHGYYKHNIAFTLGDNVNYACKKLYGVFQNRRVVTEQDNGTH